MLHDYYIYDAWEILYVCLADCGHMALQFSIYKLKTLISLLIDSDVFDYTIVSLNVGCFKVHS